MVAVRPFLFAMLLVSLACAAPSPVAAQCRLCATRATTDEAPTTATPTEPTALLAPDTTFDTPPSEPLTIEVRSALDFDRILLASEGGGRAVLDPQGDHFVEGSVESIGGRALVGEIVVRGEPLRPVSVTLPRTIEMIGAKGGVLRVQAVLSDLPSNPTLDSSGTLTIRLGGDVQVDGDLEGDFRGNFSVDVDYL